jgi:hypothetical protein
MKKYILAALASLAISAQAETFDLGQTLTFTIACTTAEYSVNRYDPTDGTWHIAVQLNLVTPYPYSPEQEQPVRFDAHTSISISVSGPEIAAYAGLEPGQLPSEVMTGKQINDAVQAIAFSKVMAAYGVTPQ